MSVTNTHPGDGLPAWTINAAIWSARLSSQMSSNLVSATTGSAKVQRVALPGGIRAGVQTLNGGDSQMLTPDASVEIANCAVAQGVSHRIDAVRMEKSYD
jgi:hypothetical protein